MLTPSEERQFATEFREQDNLDAARQLVLSHLRLVVSIARNYLGYGLPHADLIQEGNIGLMKAVKRFDPEQNVRLVSYAMHWIKAEIHEYILRNWRMVKVATTKAQRKLFFNLRSHKQGLRRVHAGRDRRSRERAEREARGSRRDGNAPVRRRHRAGRPGRGRRGSRSRRSPIWPTRIASRPPCWHRVSATSCKATALPARSNRWTRAAAASSRRAGCNVRRRRLGRLDAARTGRRIRRIGRADSPDRSQRDEEDALGAARLRISFAVKPCRKARRRKTAGFLFVPQRKRQRRPKAPLCHGLLLVLEPLTPATAPRRHRCSTDASQFGAHNAPQPFPRRCGTYPPKPTPHRAPRDADDPPPTDRAPRRAGASPPRHPAKRRWSRRRTRRASAAGSGSSGPCLPAPQPLQPQAQQRPQVQHAAGVAPRIATALSDHRADFISDDVRFRSDDHLHAGRAALEHTTRADRLQLAFPTPCSESTTDRRRRVVQASTIDRFDAPPSAAI